MRLTYDPKHNIAYLRFREQAASVETVHLSDEVNIDIAADGTVYGIELLNANAQLRAADGGRFVIQSPSGEEIAFALPGGTDAGWSKVPPS